MRLKIFLLVFLFSVQCKAQYYFEPIGTGQGMTPTGGPQTLCADTSNHLLFILGNFKKADNVVYNGSCVWNGAVYDSLLNFGSVPTGTFRTVSWGDTTVITWDSAIRLMNGTQLLQFLPSTQASFGHSGVIYSICILNNELFIGGDFKIAGSSIVNNVAKWNGAEWESVGGGITGTIPIATNIETIGTYNNDLIVAGHFDSIGGVAAKNIARWDGAQWHDMGGADPTSASGTYIRSMKEYNGDFYIAGGFAEVGGVSCLGFAKWNGTGWSVPNSDINFGAYDLEVYNNKLFISGNIVGTSSFGALASYDGDSIKFYGDHAWIYTMEVFDSFLYIGGTFDSMEGVYCNRIARFYEDSETGLHEVPFEYNPISIYPNPATESVTVTWDAEVNEVELKDLLGRTIINQSVTTSERQKQLNIANLNNGVYLLTIKTNKSSRTVKVIKD